MVIGLAALVGDARELTAAVLVEHLGVEAVFDDGAHVLGKHLRRRHDGARREARLPALAHVRSEEVQRLGIAVDEDRLVTTDPVDELLEVLGPDLERGDEQAAHEPCVDALPDHLRTAHADGLVPEPCLTVTEAPAGPLQRPQRGGEAHLELVPIDVDGERLARRPAGRDLVHVVLVVVVGEEVEVQVLAYIPLREQRQATDVLDRLDVFGPHTRLGHQTPVVGNVDERVLHEPLELGELHGGEVFPWEPLRAFEVEVQLA